MSIEYHCRNCGKKFKPKYYTKLEMMPTSQGRKCDSCGKEIKAEDKIVKI